MKRKSKNWVDVTGIEGYLENEVIYGYVYKMTNLVNGLIYIGQRKHNPSNDYYWGSGRDFQNRQKRIWKKKFQKRNFTFML